MVKIRLRRMGAKKRPFYRIVIADSRAARDGRFIESVGTYDPTVDPPAIKVNAERVAYWLSNGAQPTDTARALLKSAGFFGGQTSETKPQATKAGRNKAEPAAVEASAGAAEIQEEKPSEEPAQTE